MNQGRNGSRIGSGSAGGTRFRLFCQAPLLAAFHRPVTIELSPSPGSIDIGPTDRRIAVIRPLGKRRSYGQLLLAGAGSGSLLPPWRGPVAEPARPGPGGHFDHLAPEDPTFAQAHAYACIRLALDVWEGYLGRRVPWYFGRTQSWLEVGLLADGYDNGEVGWGWLELGADSSPDRPPQPFALNLDVIAHEVGHLIVYGTVGEPRPQSSTAEYAGFQEAAADLVALLVAARLDPVVDEVLGRTHGNLYVANELNRLAELSSSTQIRVASNAVKLSEFALGWSNEHELSEPLTGAVFDLLLDIYQSHLVERGLIPASLAALVEEVGHLRSFAPMIQAEYDRWYPRDPAGFRDTLADACDRLGAFLAWTLTHLAADGLTYVAVQRALQRADLELGGGRFAAAIEENFAWREIGRVAVGPYLSLGHGPPAAQIRGLHLCARRGPGGGSPAHQIERQPRRT